MGNNSNTPRNILGDRRVTDWFHVDNSLIDVAAREIGVYGVAVYVALCRHAGNKTTAFPSTRRLAEELGISRSKVQDTLRSLAKHGLIEKEERSSEQGDSDVNLYHLRSPTTSGATDQGMSRDDRVARSTGQGGPQHGRGVARSTGTKNIEVEEEKVKNTPTGGASDDAEGSEQNGKAQDFGQYLTQQFYDSLKEEKGILLGKQEFGFHLGKFGEMVRKYEPEPEEAGRVVRRMVDKLAASPNIDAMKAIQDVRLGRDTGEAWNEPAPWEKQEPVNPHSEEGAAMRDKPRLQIWYESAYGLTPDEVMFLFDRHHTHAALIEAIERYEYMEARNG